MRLAFRFIAGLKQPLRFCFVVSLETGLFASDFVFKVKNAPRTPYQTEPLFHCFTHGWECKTIGACRVSEQWPNIERTAKQVKIPVKL